MTEAKIRRTEITIETHSVTIIRTTGKPFSAYCEHCEENVAAFTPEQVAGICGLTLAEVCRRIETGQFCLTRTGRGTALICSNSLVSNGNK